MEYREILKRTIAAAMQAEQLGMHKTSLALVGIAKAIAESDETTTRSRVLTKPRPTANVLEFMKNH